jgi:hypothetical protein
VSNLAARLDSFPEAWKPQPGDKLIGELVDLDLRQSDYGDPYPILTVDAASGSTMGGEPISGEHAWHAFHTMGRSAVAKQRPRIGEQIGVSYHGKGTAAAPGMNPPERWRLIVDRPREQQPQVDWDTLAGVAETTDSVASTSRANPSESDDIPF